MRIEPVFLFDLDGTLVDSVYQHVLAWKEALDSEGIELSVWRIHRKIGMSGGLFTNQLIRETGVEIDEARIERLRQLHAAAYRRMGDHIRPLPGARELLSWLTNAGIRWAIATSGRMETAAVNLNALGVDPAHTPVVTRDQVKYAKPDPDLFLVAAERLGAPIETAVVVGDSIWDMLAAARCRAFGVGLLCGGSAPPNFNRRPPFASMKIRPICWCTSTSSADGGDAAMTVIDSHQHFWDPAVTEFSWMTDVHKPIRRRFSPEDLRPTLAANGVDATVLVQTWHSVEETRDFLAIAAGTDFVAGVVGWVDLTDAAVERTLEDLRSGADGRRLVGIRHLVHDEPDSEWLLRDDVRRGLAVLDRRGLVYDLLLKVREIPAALRTVADFPNLRFVVDHIAKPNIAADARSPWSELMDGFKAHRDHVWCKLSGMAEEADWASWRPDQLAPFVRRVLDIFEPDRCMFGSNWPVCLLAGDYRRIKAALEQCLSGLAEAERARVMGGSAIDAYRLRIPAR